jgi:hypothetical protein
MACSGTRTVRVLALACALLATIGAPHARAERRGDPRNEIWNGWYLNARYRNAAVEGGFDGESVLVGNNLVTLVPSLAPLGGGEVGLSIMGAGGGFGLGWSEDRYDATWLGAKGKAKVTNFDIAMRFALSTHLPVQPHAVLGMGFKKLIVEDGGLQAGRVGDASYGGLSADAGLGVTAPLAKWVMLDLSAVHAWIHYRTISVGKGSSIQIQDGVNGGGWALRAGLLLKLRGL